MAPLLERHRTGTALAIDVGGTGVKGGVVDLATGELRTAANIDKGWLGVSAEVIIGECLGRRVVALNDADAAGIPEFVCGAAAGRGGTVVMLTIGTGIGTDVFVDVHLVPNLELGHIEHAGDAAPAGRDARTWAARATT